MNIAHWFAFAIAMLNYIRPKSAQAFESKHEVVFSSGFRLRTEPI